MARFADTSYFLALLVPNDENHSAAVTLAAEWRGSLFPADFVILEVSNHVSPRKSRAIAGRFIRAISQETRMTIIPASRQLIDRGLELYESHSDKNWSLTDCISFEVMRSEKLTDALTADRHFSQAGFNILIK